MVWREPGDYSLEGEIFWDQRDQGTYGPKGPKRSRGQRGDGVFSRSLWSLGLYGLFLKIKKMRPTEAERMVYFIFIIAISYTVLVLLF